MPFPISTRGSIPIPFDAAALSDADIIVACVDQIEHERARVVSRTQSTVRFEAPFFRAWTNGWWLTALASAGQFVVDSAADARRVLRYQLSTGRNAVMGTVMTVVLFWVVIPSFETAPEVPWLFTFMMWFSGWLWIVGGNWATAAIRARFWCRKRVADAKAASTRLTPSRHPGAAT